MANVYNPQNQIKADDGKSRVDLIDPEFILGLGDVLAFGAEKYSDEGWKKIEDKHNRNYGSAMRHLLQWKAGQTADEESGKSHLLHAAYNLMVLYYAETHGE